MKKTLLLSLFLLALSSAASARKIFSIGPKIGVNFATATGFESLLDGGKTHFVGGLYAELRPIKWVGVSAEALYSVEGFTSRELNYNNSTLRADVSLGYVAFPFMAKVYLVGGLSVNVGYQPSFLVASSVTFNNSQNIDVTMEPVCHAIPVGVSYSFEFGLMADLRYNIGVSNINPLKFTQEDMQSRVWSLTLGWAF